MLDKVRDIAQEVKSFQIDTAEALEQFRLAYVAKKGKIADLFASFRDVPADEKKAFGAELNKLKVAAESKFKEIASSLEDSQSSVSEADKIDLSLPEIPNQLGSRHPLSIVRNRIIDIFSRIGFGLSEGPEIEDDWHNFTALNFPPDHPAREMQDTFFLDENSEMALRTHTSSVQVRILENLKPPVRTLAIGRVYRNEAISARAHCIFHQVEGFYVDKNVSFKDLKQTLLYFAQQFFGPDTKIRLRPSYFPFTEPSAELDIYWGLKTETDHKITKGTGWLEIGGAGMIDPNVMKNCGIDPEEYSGFAFGMGIERMAMLKYGIKDLRLFTENDVRFLRQFKSLDLA
ncbi:MAG: phenylalanine--tRNA ligase subunit alpha [Cyclobacteriaceae bacterium]